MYVQDDGQEICVAAGIAFASVNAVDDKHVVCLNFNTDTKSTEDTEQMEEGIAVESL